MEPTVRTDVKQVEWEELQKRLGTVEGLQLFRVPDRPTGRKDAWGDEVIYAGSYFVTRVATNRDANTVRQICDIPVLYEHEPLNKRAWSSTIYQYGDVWAASIQTFVSEWFSRQLGLQFVMVSSAPSVHDAGSALARLIGYVRPEEAGAIHQYFEHCKVSVVTGYHYGDGAHNYSHMTKILRQEDVQRLLQSERGLVSFYHFVRALDAPKVSGYWFYADKVASYFTE